MNLWVRFKSDVFADQSVDDVIKTYQSQGYMIRKASVQRVQAAAIFRELGRQRNDE